VDAAALEEFVKNTTFGDLRREAEEKGRQGYVAQANADGTAGLVRWDQGSVTPDNKFNQQVAGEDAKTEQAMIARLHEGLPEVKRRSAQERFNVLFERLVEQGMKSYRTFGYPVWPQSIQAKLTQLGWKERDPDVYGQCSALARQLFIEAGHKQEAKDRKRTTLGWHGHYNHELSVPSLLVGAASGLAAPAPAKQTEAS
jgi:hypothetical protein